MKTKSIKIADLKPGFTAFGNKGACWNNKVHIQNGGHVTLCRTPMLSQNAFANGERTFKGKEITAIRCEDCIAEYKRILAL